MHARTLASLSLVSLLSLSLFACGSSDDEDVDATSDTGASGAAGSGGSSAGSAGTSIAGKGGSAGTGGVGGSASGGAAGTGGSGAGGSASGGKGGSASGGASAGTGGSSSAGNGGASAAGTAGSAGAKAGAGGSASGGSASGGKGGSASGGAGGASGGSAGAAGNGQAGGFGGAPVDKPGSVEIGVRNNCGFPLWIHAAGSGVVLAPDNAELKTGEVRWYDAPESWSAARITAFRDGPGKTEIDKAEVTIGNGVINYNVTYVDWVGLPMEMLAIGTGGDCKPVSCAVPHDKLLAGCPDGLMSGDRCLSARTYCLDPKHQKEPYCGKLDAAIATCAATKPGCEGAKGASTAEAYACSGFFAQSPKWCAALNRATLDNPDDTNTATYYAKDPYNTYAKWVHQTCPGIYAFAYDDYPSNAEQSGFHACTGGKELRVTFCPGG